MTNLNPVRRCLIRKIYFEEIYFSYTNSSTRMIAS